MRVIGKIEPQRPRPPERRLRAIAVLPTLATLGNLICGIGAIYLCMLSYGAAGADLGVQTLNSARMERWFPTYIAIGCYLIFLAGFFDGIDGRLARLTRKTSEFGAQLDSLADIVSFGLAPAMLAVSVAKPFLPVAELGEMQRLWWRAEWVMCASYVCCAAMRLARFNVENVADESAHASFRGMPSPGAAAGLVGLVLLHEDVIRASGSVWAATMLSKALPFAALALGLLMVSRIRYVHMVNYLLRGRRPFLQVVLMGITLMVGAVVKPQLTVALLAFGYSMSGPLAWVVRRVRGPKAALDAASGVTEPPSVPPRRDTAGS